MKSKNRPVFKLLMFTLLPGFVFYCWPFLYLTTQHPDNRYLLGERLIYGIIMNKIMNPAESQEKQVSAIEKYVTKYVLNPNPNQPVKDVSRLRIIENGTGFCDQQVNVFLALCEAAGFKGRMVWLFGNDSISHHTVSEVFYEGKYHMFDPFYKQQYYTRNGEIASVEEIVSQSIEPLHFNATPANQKRLYGKKYRWQVPKWNSVNTEAGIHWKIIQANTAIWGRLFFIPWLKLCNLYTGIPYKSIPLLTN